jgi:DNA-binding CsgD family transcriptional regulator
VSHLILYETFAHVAPQTHEAGTALQTLILQGWGRDTPTFRQVFATLFYPEADAPFYRWYNELQRLSASPAGAAAYMAAATTVDVRSLLARVTQPTLVIHRRGDEAVPFEDGRALAAHLPGAQFLPLPGSNHLPLPHEPVAVQWQAAIRAFLAAPADAGTAATASRPLLQPPPTAAHVPSSVATAAVRAGLTVRELEVLRLMVAGSSNRDIATVLVLSENTVLHHVSSILSKTGAANRTAAARYAVQHGLVP